MKAKQACFGSNSSKVNETIRRIETAKGTCFAIEFELRLLKDKLSQRASCKFIPHKAEREMSSLRVELKQEITVSVELFYKAAVNYLQLWSKSLDGSECFHWMGLTKLPEWSDVQASLIYIDEKVGSKNTKDIDGDKVFDELATISSFVSQNLNEWNNIDKYTDSEKRWLQVFQHCRDNQTSITHLCMLVQFGFAIPGTSTEPERLFSNINDIWGPDKPHLSIEMLNAFVNVRYNMKEVSCKDFFNLVKNDKEALRKVHSSEKYN